MTRLLAVPLDESDVFLMTFMILQDSYMEPTRVGSDNNNYIIIHPQIKLSHEGRNSLAKMALAIDLTKVMFSSL